MTVINAYGEIKVKSLRTVGQRTLISVEGTIDPIEEEKIIKMVRIGKPVKMRLVCDDPQETFISEEAIR